MTVPFIEENDQTLARREHLDALCRLVGNVYPNKFERSDVTGTASGEDTITSTVETFKRLEPQVREGEKPSAEVLESANAELNKTRVRLAGRIAAPPRIMGKAAFVHLSDGVSRLQIYVRRQDVAGVHNDADGGEVSGWELFSLLDHGDFIGVEGYLFVTKTGELSVHVEKLKFLAKALLPMPDKLHGINDPEIRQRQRYADLIAGSLKLERDETDLTPREVFVLRSKIVREIRRFLDEQGYIEVETPMLTPLATGAAAKPFETYHNALGIPLYARIAPELYLKRLTVGGFEKVYELNRNFRNEGIDRQHNPEFTMLEFYWAYADVNQMMDLHEKMMRSVVQVATGGLTIRYGEHEIDFAPPFQRITMKDAIARYRGEAPSENEDPVRIVELFEEFAEPHLIQPTFITDFPKPVSPLSKASPSDPSVAERFEYFVAAIESANGFSELNDPEEQYQRFRDQVQQRERGDEEAMVMDEDYIRALSYGMPPAAGIGVGIDRLVMLLANKHSIRDVILFPHMRPERQKAEGSEQ
jgi:lysyl-tRNA synthetase, class II